MAAVEVMEKLGISETIGVGWSLVEHVGNETLPLVFSKKGLAMIHSLPVGL